jgi:hypothetical protein
LLIIEHVYRFSSDVFFCPMDYLSKFNLFMIRINMTSKNLSAGEDRQICLQYRDISVMINDVYRAQKRYSITILMYIQTRIANA